jgi:hypothetical protein
METLDQPSRVPPAYWRVRANAACDHSNPNPLSKVRIAFGVAMTREWLNELMRTLLIAALCATLIGCACPVPQSRVVETCTSQGCFSRIAATTPIELIEREPFRPAPKITTVKPKKAAIAAKPTAAKPRNETELVEEKANSRTITEPETPPPTQPPAADSGPKNATTAIGGGKAEGPASDQPSETSDPILKKAKIAVAAKMEDPTSAEFVDMKRVMRKNSFGQSFEAICGRVKGKKKLDNVTGERPFIYVVNGDDAYIVVDGNPDSLAAIVYRAHCLGANSR